MLRKLFPDKYFNYIKENWLKDKDKKRDMKLTKTLHEIIKNDSEEFYIDDQTWSDLNMDEIYKKLDINLTSCGEQKLYHILRTPIFEKEELQKRSEVIDYLKDNKAERERIQRELYILGRQNKGETLGLLKDGLNYDIQKRFLYNLLGVGAPIIVVLLMIFIKLSYGGWFLVIFAANSLIHAKEHDKMQGESIAYLGKLTRAAKRIASGKDEYLSDKFKVLMNGYKRVEYIAKSSSLIGRAEGQDALFDMFCIMFLLEERTYLKLAKKINENKKELIDLYSLVGEFDALISLAGFRLKFKYCTPRFTEDKILKIIDGIHPLLVNPVANSVELKDRGIILTGTNMSGKSTYLRMLGTNVLFAQTIYTCLCSEYEGSFFKLISSISPEDNVLSGKSYFLAEAEAVLRIINNATEKIPVFCIIDEIFRGTNPVERIAASKEILKFLMNKNTLTVAATHDHELIKLIEDKYTSFYFGEEVDEKEGLRFDYKLKEGVSPTRNAIKLLRFLGYPEDITEEAMRSII